MSAVLLASDTTWPDVAFFAISAVMSVCIIYIFSRY